MIASLSWEDEMSLDDRDSTLRPKLHKMEHKPAKVKVEVDVSESDTWDELTALHDDSSVVEDLDTDLAVTLTGSLYYFIPSDTDIYYVVNPKIK